MQQNNQATLRPGMQLRHSQIETLRLRERGVKIKTTFELHSITFKESVSSTSSFHFLFTLPGPM